MKDSGLYLNPDFLAQLLCDLVLTYSSEVFIHLYQDESYI